MSWYTTWDWRRRADAFDADCDRRRLLHRREREACRDRQVQTGDELLGMKVLRATDPAWINADHGRRLVESGMELLAKGLGDSLETPEGHATAQHETYVERIHRIRAEKGLAPLVADLDDDEELLGPE
jgi:hypothetical protein